MDPFVTTPKAPYKAENFFPTIDDEYRFLIRKGLLAEQMQVEDNFEYMKAHEEEEPFDEEKPCFDFKYSNIRPVTSGQRYNFPKILSKQVDHLVRCVKRPEDNLSCEFVKVSVGESLKGKDTMLIVCVFVPAKWCELNAQLLCPLSIVSAELSSRYPNFEIVFVPKMRKMPDMDAYYGEDAFHHFFSAFPGRLALPCTNQKACDYFCNNFNFNGDTTLVLLRGGKVVYEDAWFNIFKFGSVGFPFSAGRINSLEYQLPRSPLPTLLGLGPSSQLYKFGSSKAITIEDLGEKLVGLYLFRGGNKLRIYEDVFKQCRDRDLDAGREPIFEIVFVCVPPVSSIHPFAYEEEVSKLLTRFKVASSWWFLPYNNSACCRLKLLTQDSMDDCMIIVGPKSQYVEPYGGEILSTFGMDAFPFHRDAILQRYVEKLEKVTLQSLLSTGPVQYVLSHDKQQIPISELQGKNVILYVSDAAARAYSHFEMLTKWSKEIEKHHSQSDFEVIYLLLRDSDDEVMSKNPCRDTKWLEYPTNLEHSNRLRANEAFFYGVDSQSSKVLEGLYPSDVLLFGKDGYLHLFDARYQIFPRGKKDDPFRSGYKDLRTQLIRRMKDHLEFLDGYEYGEE